MRRHAKASSAGSTQRQATGFRRIFRGTSATRAVSPDPTGSGAPRVRRLTLPVALFIAALTTLALAAPASAAVVKDTWADDVIFTEATVKATINPEGVATTYHFEYGTTVAYGEQTPELPVGSDSADHDVVGFLEGLQPGTTYHYRAVATNGGVGPDRTFTTFTAFAPDIACPNQDFRVGPSAKLPDCRAYEMVSPVDKAGRDAGMTNQSKPFPGRSSLDGNKVTFKSGGAFGDAVSGWLVNDYTATRGPNGWTTHGINPPQQTSINDPGFGEYDLLTAIQGVGAFTPDLSTTWINSNNFVPLAPGGREGVYNLYERNTITDALEAVTTNPAMSDEWPPEISGVTADGQVFFNRRAAMTPNAVPSTAIQQVYRFFQGDYRLISILPNGEANPGHSHIGTGHHTNRSSVVTSDMRFENAVSDDGSRVVWAWTNNETGDEPARIYVNINGEPSIPVSQSVTPGHADYWTADSNVSTVIFSYEETLGADPNDNILYEFDVESGTPTHIADDVIGVVGSAEDLSRIYFVSLEALDVGATAEEPNLYVRDGGGITFIATLGSGGDGGNTNFAPGSHRARVTPDGGQLVFASTRPLTGYDSTDQITGNPVQQLFRYDAETGELNCVSCNPGGARPIGAAAEEFGPQSAAFLPPWPDSLYALRPMSDDGSRIFFNAFDALLPQDTNDSQDVYEWEAPGSGSCDVGDPSYSERNDGCIYLISTGQSNEESSFFDADPDGENVFIRTASSLVPQDPGITDVYVAREGGGYLPPTGGAACEGEACQAAPEAPNDPTPASSTFQGAGNVKEAVSSPRRCPKGKRRVRKGGKVRCVRKRGKRVKRASDRKRKRTANNNRRTAR